MLAKSIIIKSLVTSGLVYTGMIFLLMTTLSCKNPSDAQHKAYLPEKASHNSSNMLNWNEVLQLARKGSPPPDRRNEKTEAEWKASLSPDVYQITREKGTERPFTGAYCSSHAPGIYACICCGTPLFDANEKFDSGSGWPSFTTPVKDNVIKYEKDRSYGMVRVEVLCNSCDAHLGHVFPDGPGPGGLRFCINSASIVRISE
jgi:peptide-methionine (R)-S-oxide reductase